MKLDEVVNRSDGEREANYKKEMAGLMWTLTHITRYRKIITYYTWVQVRIYIKLFKNAMHLFWPAVWLTRDTSINREMVALVFEQMKILN